MTLKTKSLSISATTLAVIALSMALFNDYNNQNDSIITNLIVTEKILGAEDKIHKYFTNDTPDLEAAKQVVETIPGIIRPLEVTGLTGDELHSLVTVKLSFVRIKRLLQDLSGVQDLSAPELQQVRNELSKIETSTAAFREAFGRRSEQERRVKKNIVLFLYLTGGTGILFVLMGLYRYFIGPILTLSAEIKDVRDGKKKTISIYPVEDEIGRLSEFTNQTLRELYQSNEALSKRLEMQNAFSDILKASQEAEDVDRFLAKVLDTILSLKWLNIMGKGSVFLVDDIDPNTLVLRAEKNFSPSQKSACARVALGTCICGQAARSGELVYGYFSRDDHQHTHGNDSPHGHYCLPIKHEQTVLGIISLYFEEENALGDMERSFIDAVSLLVTKSLVIKKHAEREHLITRAIEESGEGIMIADRSGIISYINPALERLTGYSRQELIGTAMDAQILPGELLPQTVATILQGALWSGVLNNRRKDGSKYQEHMTVVPVRNERGEVMQFVASRRDMTKERRLEEQLAQAQKMELIGRLAGGIAHDFNNFMTAILGYSGVVMKNLKDARALKGMETMIKAAKMAANLTRQLLAFSRKQVIRPKVMNINMVIEESVRMLKHIIQEDIELEVLLAPDLGNAKADPGQLEQALMNLVVNAKDAMPAGGKLTIQTSNVCIDRTYAQSALDVLPGEYVLISASDTGQGMTAEVKTHLFEPFFTTKEQGKGTGLGLAMVHGIVKQNGGHITVHSVVGEGTTFRIYLPRVMDAVEQEKKDREDKDLLRGLETVLVVEDQEVVRELAVDLLSDLGYTVMEAKDGMVALDLCRRYRGKVHVLLTDVIMPKLGGRELAARVREIHPETRVLYMSGYEDGMIARHGVLDEDIDLMSKPFTEASLARDIRKVLDR